MVDQAEPDLGLQSSFDLASDPGKDETSRTFNRGRLVVPVIIIMLISILAICGLVWTGAKALNIESEETAVRLARSMVGMRLESLVSVARDYALTRPGLRDLASQFDSSWAAENLGQNLADDFNVTSAWVLTHDQRTIAGFIDGKPAGREFLSWLPVGIKKQIERVRRVGDKESRAIGGFARNESGIHLVAVGRIGPQSQTGEVATDVDGVIVLTQALDDEFLAEGARNFALPGLNVVRGAPPRGYKGLPIVGEGAHRLGTLVWFDKRPGDRLLWPLSPALAGALIALAYVLFLFFRDADLFLERQAFLASALKHERRLRDLKSRFVSMVSHELRTPLATIRSAAELLERYSDRMSPSDREEELKAIEKAVDSLTILVDNVLVIGKSDWLETKGSSHAVDVRALVEDVWEESARALKAEHELRIVEKGDIENVYGDQTILRALLSHLLQNAINYSRGRDEVLVTITRSPETCRVAVTDHGIGIPAEDLDTIFEPFQRAGNAESLSGTGLGLAVARAAVRSMGGDITVESKPGAGSTFEVSLPQGRPA